MCLHTGASDSRHEPSAALLHLGLFGVRVAHGSCLQETEYHALMICPRHSTPAGQANASTAAPMPSATLIRFAQSTQYDRFASDERDQPGTSRNEAAPASTATTSAVRQADRILVFENGRVVEEGVHDSLMQRGGLYHKLYAHA